VEAEDMSDLIEKVKDAVRKANPYWDDPVFLTDEEAEAAVATVIQHIFDKAGVELSEAGLLVSTEQ
jgi:hypothetical protein